jgi:hypothetical protein
MEIDGKYVSMIMMRGRWDGKFKLGVEIDVLGGYAAINTIKWM